MAKYNGYRSWNAWNVALWLSNDEALYRLAEECLNRYGGNLKQATNALMKEIGGKRTPDGAVYNQRCVHEALEEIRWEMTP